MPAPSRPIRLLIALTAAVLLGPLAIGFVFRGGESSGWPPDRPVEWIALAAPTALDVFLMGATIATGWAEMKKPIQKRAEGERPPA